MLKAKYHKFTFYCHNFGNYDLYFIYIVLEDFNIDQANPDNYYNMNMTFRDDQVLKLDIKIKNNDKTIKISFIDSLNILNGSLEQLAIDFKVQTLALRKVDFLILLF
jgi:hypothetical protein